MSTARRVLSIVVGLGLLAVAAGGFAARYAPITGHRTLYVVIASPYLLIAAPVGLLVLLWGRRWVLASATALLTVAFVAPQLPWFVSADPDPGGVRIRAMTLNMFYGQADPASLVRVADERADVVMVEELTKEAASALSAAGIGKAFPHQALDAQARSSGTGVYSRYPITDVDRIGGYAMAMISARIRVDGVTPDPTVLALHLAGPWPQPIDAWRRDVAKLPNTLAQVASAADGGAVLVGGDFNSTVDMRPFRKLLTGGYRDAAEQAGDGRDLTYPANKRMPAFMDIDHFLTRECTAVSTQTVEVPKTDHRALLAAVVLPR